MRQTYIIGKLCLTTVFQSGNAPLIDRCWTTTVDRKRHFAGRAILLTPWRRKYGQAIPQTALVIAWEEKR